MTKAEGAGQKASEWLERCLEAQKAQAAAPKLNGDNINAFVREDTIEIRIGPIGATGERRTAWMTWDQARQFGRWCREVLDD